MSMWLTVEARVAAEFSIHATGRNADVCGDLDDSLIVATYRDVLTAAGKKIVPLALEIDNEIPLGMGCGSSAAALLAGVALAEHFGGLGLGEEGIVGEASRMEGHPDNVAACWYGGFTVSALTDAGVGVATFAGDEDWRLLLVMQASSLATKKARALLPEAYKKADAVFNVQRTAMLVAAFAQRRLDLLATAMQDRLHQPYRMEACPLLRALLPLSGKDGVAGVALSGAGPSVLVILGEGASEAAVRARIEELAGADVEMLALRIAGGVERTANGLLSR